MPKIEVQAWLDADSTRFTNLPSTCPKCQKKLSKVDATRLCGIIFIYCLNYKCRFADVYET